MSISNYRARQVGVGALAAALSNMYVNNRSAVNRAVGEGARSVYNYVSRAGGAKRQRTPGVRRRAGVRAHGSPNYVVPQRSGRNLYRRKFRRRRLVKRKGIKKRFSRRRKGGSYRNMLRKIWREIHCPQILKLTQAFMKQSVGIGCRTWTSFYCGSLTDIGNMIARRPSGNFFTYSAQTPGTATTQQPFGDTKGLHVTKGYFKFTVQNRDNWDMHLKVYECLLRKDQDLITANTEDAYFSSGTGFSAEHAYTNLGPLAPGYAGGNDLLTKIYHHPTFTPYMSSGFCEDWKILKTHVFELGPNQYASFVVNLGRYGMSMERYARMLQQTETGLGKWSKLLMFTWVGGPVDTGLASDAKQSKSNNTLAVQYESEFRWYFERRTDHLFTIASSNATATEKGISSGSNYDTVSTDIMYVPATCTVQTVPGTAAAAGHRPDDMVTDDHL